MTAPQRLAAEPVRGVHPAAEAFPKMAERRFTALVDDIRAHGLMTPIMLDGDGRILDGRHRYRACLEADVEPTFQSYDGDPVVYVTSANLNRRHLTRSQRALVAARLARLRLGANQHTTPAQACAPSVSQEKAAELLNVSRRSVQHARVVVERGVPELVDAVEVGDVAVSRAAAVAVLDPEQQREALADRSPAPAPKVLDFDALGKRQRMRANAHFMRLADLVGSLKGTASGLRSGAIGVPLALSAARPGDASAFAHELRKAARAILALAREIEWTHKSAKTSEKRSADR